MKPDPEKIYPYVVPLSSLGAAGSKERMLSWPLGFDLHVTLVHDLAGLVGNVSRDDLAALGLTAEAARERAVSNLVLLASSGAIKQARFANGPADKPFVLFGGHWAAAACILLPELRRLAVKNVGSEEVCVCIPHRDALLIFPKGDRAYRDSMRALVKAKESDGSKPLTFEFFELSPAGIREVKE